jgi:hypothetical protein
MIERGPSIPSLSSSRTALQTRISGTARADLPPWTANVKIVHVTPDVITIIQRRVACPLAAVGQRPQQGAARPCSMMLGEGAVAE